MRVDVYRNLQRDCLSVKSMEPDDRYGLVIAHKQKVHISDAEFVVNANGREKARETGVRNVHAFVRGEWDESEKLLYGESVAYNPFEHDHFVHTESERAVESAELCAVTINGVFAKGLSHVEE